jgi:acyl carrier protein
MENRVGGGGRERPGRADIEAYLLATLEELAQDWDHPEKVGPDTGLFSDLGFESLDAVVLGTAIQEHYDRPMPFAELLVDVGQREVRELTVGELISFVEAHFANGTGEE